jgi:hypothetical protein
VTELSESESRERFGDHAMRIAARHACWRGGNLGYILHEGQKEVNTVLAESMKSWRRFVLNVGRRWGKSLWLCVMAVWLLTLRQHWRRGTLTSLQMLEWAPWWLVEQATRTKKRGRVIYAAPTGAMIEDFVAPHMMMLEEHSPPELRIELRNGVYQSADGDRIVMRGCEDRKKADRLRGSEADMAIVDECGYIPHLAYVTKSVIGFQLAETRGPRLMSSTPPESPDHPWVGFVEEAELRGAYYHAATYDAPHINEVMLKEIIDDVGGVDTVGYAREVEALMVRDPSIVVLPEFDDELVGEVERPEHFVPAIIGDMGFVDMTVIALGYYNFDLDIYIVEREVAGQRMRSDELEAAITTTARELWGDKPEHKIRRRLDGTARERAEMSGEGDGHFSAVSRDGKNPGGRMRTLANQARKLCKQARVLIHPSCMTIIAHAKHARWNAQRNDFVRAIGENNEPEHHYDGAAALLYFLRDCDAGTNPYPFLPPGVSEQTHFIPPNLRRKSSRKARLAERFKGDE